MSDQTAQPAVGDLADPAARQALTSGLRRHARAPASPTRS